MCLDHYEISKTLLTIFNAYRPPSSSHIQDLHYRSIHHHPLHCCNNPSLISYNRRLQHACLIVDNYSSNSFACEFLSLLASTNLTQHVNLIWPLWHRHTSIPVLIISSFHLCQSR